VSTLPELPAQKRPWAKSVLAAILSLLFPGAGQLLNRQPRKAVLFLAIWFVLTGVDLHTRALFSFWSMVAMFALRIVLSLIASIDAGRGALLKRRESPVPNRVLAYVVIIVCLVLQALFPGNNYVKAHMGFAAFRIPSQSMCPTLCIGDRFVADASAYRSKSPRRGDLVMLSSPDFGQLLVKRIVGLPGDVIARDAHQQILVNDQPFKFPSQCQLPEPPSPDSEQEFETSKVPPSFFFVLGDNLPHSLDSRYPQFGLVPQDQIRGKPLFLYWSPNKKRIGCNLH
jgi:signal peptidase I